MSELTDRFLRYVRINTASDPASKTMPTTSVQMDFLRLLRQELETMGMEDIELDEAGALYASLPGEGGGSAVIGLLAHVDTSPDAPGECVKPRIHSSWNGGPISLEDDQVIDPDETEDMGRYEGGTIITGDGTTLLGADDKAGVAIIMEVCRELMKNLEMKRPALRVAFTTDEEVGRGVDGFDVKKFGADLAYTVDGGCVGKVDTQTFNAWSADWEVQGREVHPGSACGIMVNAVRILADIASSLLSEEMPENSRDREGFIYPMRISGSTARGSLKMIVRDFTNEGMEGKLEYLRKLRDMMSARYPRAGISLTLKEQYSNPGEVLKRDRRLAEYALKGTEAAGLDARESSIRGGTDGSRLSFMGVPTVNLPTGGEFFHSRKEWIAEEGMELAKKIVLNTLEIWGGE